MSKFSIHSPTIIRGIPLADLWQHLVIVACQNTSHRRLQMIGLILEILMLYKDNLLNGGPCTAASSSSSSTVKKIDFGLLRPLWKLYYSLLEDLGEGGSVSRTHASDVFGVCAVYDETAECYNTGLYVNGTYIQINVRRRSLYRRLCKPSVNCSLWLRASAR